MRSAVKLFAELGFDDTRVEDICRDAGVSLRTFFRHFQNKQSVLPPLGDDGFGWFVEAYASKPRDVPEEAAIASAFGDTARLLEADPEPLRQYWQAVQRSPLLRGKQQEIRERRVADVSRALANRRKTKPDLATRVLATVVMAVFEMAVTDWALGRSNKRMSTLVPERFRILFPAVPADGFAGPGSAAPIRARERARRSVSS